jgi:regulatory protein
MAGEMKVTALKLQARNPGRVNVYLDGEFALGLVKVLAARLRVGQELSEADLAALRQADAEEDAYGRVLRRLATRPRSEAEIRKQLRQHPAGPAGVDAVLARLRQAGLIDDRSFAAGWVENRGAFRPRSRRALQAELRRKGVAEETVRQAVAGVDETEAAYQAASRQARRLAGLPKLDFQRHLAAFLGRRGFDFGIIEVVVERVWSEQQEPARDSGED